MILSHTRIALALTALMLQLSPVSALAQTPTSDQESMTLMVGDILEILPVHDLSNATYTWILTEDRTFIEAARTASFRKRIITPGRFTLYAEVASADGQEHLTRTFTLNVEARTPGQDIPTTDNGADGALVRSTPELSADGRIVLPEGSSMVTIIPINPDLRPVVADVDLDRDSDGNGDTENDIDTQNTFFQSDATPLTLWLAEPFDRHRIAVTGITPEGATVQQIEIYTSASAASQGIGGTGGITIEETKDQTYAFSVSSVSAPPDAPLLYQWEFGDGKQSLLASPVHTYMEAGTFTVKVRIRNLTDGKEIASLSQDITVEEGASVVIPPEEMPEEPEPSDNEGSLLGSILLLAGVFLASVVVGVGGVILFSKMRKRGKSLSDHLETMEKTIVGTASQPATVLPPVLTIAQPLPPQKKEEPKPAPTPAPQAPVVQKPTTPPPSIAQREIDDATTNPVLDKPLTIDEKQAPAWLKSGLAAPAPAPVQTPRPQPAPPRPTPPAPTPTPAPQPQVPTQAPKPLTPPQSQPTPAPTPKPVQTTPAATPPWLQPVQSSQPTPSPVPPTPKPVPPAPTPSPAPTPAPTPIPPVDQEIATIRVESIEPQTPTQDEQNPPASQL